MAVFPENMDRLNLEDPKESLSIIQEYIRYMGERIDFSFRNMTKSVSAAGISSPELYILIQDQAQALAALQSTVNSTIQGTISTIQNTLTSLDQRITALESQATP